MEQLNDGIEVKLFRKDSIPSNGIAIVVDNYLATTNMVIFFQRHVSKLFIVNEANLAEAQEQFPEALLIGESLQEVKFNISNSTSEISQADLSGRIVLYMTMNGTKALEALDFKALKKVFVCSFLNLTAVCERVKAIRGDDLVTILKSGNLGQDTSEDDYCATLIKDKLRGLSMVRWNYIKDIKEFCYKTYNAIGSDVEIMLKLDSYKTVLEAKVLDNNLVEILEARR